MSTKLDNPLTDAECEAIWRSPPRINGKPVFSYDPNDCCFDLTCTTCGGRVWIGDYYEELVEGQEVGIAWYAPRYEVPSSEDVMWVRVARDSEGQWYVEPEGGW